MTLQRKTPLRAKSPLQRKSYLKSKQKSKKEKSKFEISEIKKRTKGFKSVSSLEKKLDRIFSRYIRLRDTKPYDFRYGKCISCGRVLPYDKLDCGHFHSRIHRNTRYDEDNCHCECHYCNRMSADHLIKYQENLIKKIGQQRFDLLKVKASMTCKRTAFELELMIKEYEKKVKELEKGKEK